LGNLEQKIDQNRDAFRVASNEWTLRFEQMKEVDALKAELESLHEALQQAPWTDEKAGQLATALTQLGVHRQLSAEVSILQEQLTGLKTRRDELEVSKASFAEQCRNVSDLQAVSDFLSYDNGPQKFLQSFFRDVLSQTNCLLSDMGLPVSLHLGPDLEFIVQEGRNKESSSLALGGGYANLIGIAFRIALQRLILPRVHTVILDEPSTHVDERNMEILVPFFERLRNNLASYGIEQCIFIDHHPAWKNSSIGVIQLGNQNGSI
jgi:DNA repair protein SbcC/Rad50